MEKIREVHIDVEASTIVCIGWEGETINFPLSSTGGPHIKYTKVSSGGHIIQALVRMLEDVHNRGGNSA